MYKIDSITHIRKETGIYVRLENTEGRKRTFYYDFVDVFTDDKTHKMKNMDIIQFIVDNYFEEILNIFEQGKKYYEENGGLIGYNRKYSGYFKSVSTLYKKCLKHQSN
ncbi:MAG: hypothetical protein ACRC6E_02235 [Fusobacteriaceae bacterium]